MAFRLANRIYVGNIPWTIGNKELREYFSQFGRVLRAEVIFDRNTGLSRNYGFVNFGNEDGYQNVYKQKSHFLEGQYLEIEDRNGLNNNFNVNVSNNE